METLLPTRRVEDALAGRVRVTLGGRLYELPVRSIASNRRWVESLDAHLAAVAAAIDAVPDGDYEALDATLAAFGPEGLIELLVSYDEAGVLPPRDELEEIARPAEALFAVLGVRRAAHPLLDVGLAALMAVTPGPASRAPTSSSPTSTDGTSEPSMTD